jgi:hypothetical protein
MKALMWGDDSCSKCDRGNGYQRQFKSDVQLLDRRRMAAKNGLSRGLELRCRWRKGVLAVRAGEL